MQKQDSTHRQKGQHLTSLERRKVAGFRQAGKSNRWIAAEIGVCPQTINNETWIIHRISKKQRNPTIHTGLRCFGVSLIGYAYMLRLSR